MFKGIPQTSKDSKNYQFLIKKQLEQIKQGGQSNKLIELINEYEFSIEKVPRLQKIQIFIYIAGLIIAFKYVEIKVVVCRNKKQLAENQVKLFATLVSQASKFNFGGFNNCMKNVVQIFTACKIQIVQQVKKAAKSHIIQSLSKCYVTMDISYLSQLGITRQDLQSNQCQIQNNYANFSNCIIPSNIKFGQLMQERSKQLISITEHIIRN